MFLRALVNDLQHRFIDNQWGGENLPEWLEGSSCSCERVFSYMAASDHAQPTAIMSATLLVRCNGPDVEDWCPLHVFRALHRTQFRPKKRADSSSTDKDLSLLLFKAFKDVKVEWSDVPHVNADVKALWVVPKRKEADEELFEIPESFDTEEGGVASDEDDMDATVPSTPEDELAAAPEADVPVTQAVRHVPHRIVFQYDIDARMAESLDDGTFTDWHCIELRAFCRRHGLPVSGTLAQLRARTLRFHGR